jgi:hypothetical protein
MRGSRFNFAPGISMHSSTIEQAREVDRENQELRRARIMNGAEPSQRNGPSPRENFARAQKMLAGTRGR